MNLCLDLRTRVSGNQRGQTLILVAVSLLSLLGIAALAIDMTTLYVAKAEIQHAADAAALAGAKALVDSGVTSDPSNTSLQAVAQTMAQDFITAVVAQNKVAGALPHLVGNSPVINVTPVPNALGNPRVTVTLQRTDLPLFFARIWGSSPASVSAMAVAEAYNPAFSQSNTGSFMPSAPKCVKPFLVPNNDPNPSQAGATFVDPTTGAVNASATSFVGEAITLTPACLQGGPNSPCTLPPFSRGSSQSLPPSPGQYLPLRVPESHLYCPSPSAPGCSGGGTDFEKSTRCCDGIALDFLQCGGSTTSATWDQFTNPWGPNGPAKQGLQCLIHTTSQGPPAGNAGQDTLFIPGAPPNPGQMQIQAGDYSHSRYNVPIGTLIGTSDSIITVPLFENNPAAPMPPEVNVVGFLQLFVDYVGPTGDVHAHILNVSGCGNSGSGTVASGGGVSPIPVRLIHN